VDSADSAIGEENGHQIRGRLRQIAAERHEGMTPEEAIRREKKACRLPNFLSPVS